MQVNFSNSSETTNRTSASGFTAESKMFSQSVVIVFKFQTIFSVEVSRRLVCDDDDDDELYSCVDVFS